MEREEKTNFTKEDRWLIFALLAAAGGWSLHLTISYCLVPESCGDGTKSFLHFVTAGALVVTLMAAAIAWRVRATAVDARSRFFSLFVAVLSLFFTLVVIAQEIPNVLLRSCD